MDSRQSEQTATLDAALAKAAGLIEYIRQTGEVKFGGTSYDYATVADLCLGVRDHLASQGIATTPWVEVIEWTKAQCRIDLYYTLRHKGEWAVCRIPGVGYGDKGMYAAMTGAQKYFLRTTFQIAVGDDPEEHDNQRATQGSAVRETPPEKPRKAKQQEGMQRSEHKLKSEPRKPTADPAVVDGIAAAARVLVDMQAYNDETEAHNVMKRAVYELAGRDVAAMTHAHVREALAAITEERLG